MQTEEHSSKVMTRQMALLIVMSDARQESLVAVWELRQTSKEQKTRCLSPSGSLLCAAGVNERLRILEMFKTSGKGTAMKSTGGGILLTDISNSLVLEVGV